MVSVFHLMVSLTLVVIIGMIFQGFIVGMMLTSIGASLSQPFFVAWSIRSMRLREEEISKNLLVAREYAHIEPETTKYWWKGKDYKRYEIRHALVWQCCLIPLSILLVYSVLVS